MVLHSRLLWKIYASYSALILALAVVVGLLISKSAINDTLDEIRQSLEYQAIFLRDLSIPTLQGEPDALFQERVRNLGADIDTRLTVIDASGVVLADSDGNPARMDNHGSRPEVLASQREGFGMATRYSNSVGMRMMYYALTVSTSQRPIGYVRTALPLSIIDQRLGHLRRAIIIGLVMAMIIALLLGFVLARHFVQPLAAMTMAAHSMSQGDYDKRIHLMRTDEIGTLATALNHLAASCKDRTETILSDRNRLSTILSGMTEGVIAVNADERVTHMNRAAAKILAVSAEESLGRPIWEISRMRQVSELLTEAMCPESNEPSHEQLVASGEDQFIEMRAAPLNNGQGERVGAVIVLRDVSNLRRLEMIREEFVANASHELKTPITAIRGLVETMIDDKELPPAQRERFLERIWHQSMRLSSLSMDLLTLSRLDANHVEGEESLVDLRELVLDAVESLISMSETKGVPIHAEGPADAMEVVGNEEALCQVVNNLLDNALKYTPAGGKVDVRLTPQGDEIVLEVQDTGIGIARKDLPRIFERFYRVDKARSREVGGTGLGLSIVKHIVKTHGGRLSVDSVPGKGSTFRVILPGARETDTTDDCLDPS